MNRIIICSLLAGAIAVSCATLTGKASEKRIDKLAELCKEEHLEFKPAHPHWANMSTYQRRRKRREIDEYNNERIGLYRALDRFRELYLSSVDSNGNCTSKDCRYLGALRSQILAACPETGKKFPVARTQ